MVIERDGKRYELTDSELETAYREKQRCYLEIDAGEAIGWVHDDGLIEKWKYVFAIQPESGIIPKIADVFERNDDCNISFNDMMYDTAADVLKGLNMSDHVLEVLWEALGDIQVDDDGCIEQEFMGYEIGTNREEIWHWFDDLYSGGVAKLMNLI